MSEFRLTKNSVISAVDDVIDSEIDDELVMMNIDTGDYFGLNDVATAVWLKVRETTTYSDLIESLIEEFDVKPEQCETEVNELLTQLNAAKLIEVS